MSSSPFPLISLFQALEKLSHDHPGSLLRNGALVATLSYVDFFQTGVQRVAVATAANMCRGLTPEHAEAANAAAPILIGLLQYQVGGWVGGCWGFLQ
jgi:E3 ubiquitin-protein ligase TRIP12